MFSGSGHGGAEKCCICSKNVAFAHFFHGRNHRWLLLHTFDRGKCNRWLLLHTFDCGKYNHRLLLHTF